MFSTSVHNPVQFGRNLASFGNASPFSSVISCSLQGSPIPTKSHAFFNRRLTYSAFRCTTQKKKWSCQDPKKRASSQAELHVFPQHGPKPKPRNNSPEISSELYLLRICRSSISISNEMPEIRQFVQVKPRLVAATETWLSVYKLDGYATVGNGLFGTKSGRLASLLLSHHLTVILDHNSCCTYENSYVVCHSSPAIGQHSGPIGNCGKATRYAWQLSLL